MYCRLPLLKKSENPCAMSDLKYFNYDGFGTFAREHYGYNQAVRIGDRIEISGQGTLPHHTPPLYLFLQAMGTLRAN
jgi:hypothetical protein